MWMSYVKYTEIVDLKTGVENLSELFSMLAWNAHHEAIYGMNRLYSYEEYEKTAESELAPNVEAFFFDSIIYELCGNEVDSVRDPGRVNTIRGYMIYGITQHT